MRKVLVMLLIALGTSAAASAENFFPDDPLWKDEDRLPIPKPVRIELSQLYDFAENTFGHPAEKNPKRAQNVNTIGQVPDSSWFTNRIGNGQMTMEEILRGPLSGPGPDMSDKWRIVSAKSEGISPGFRIEDARGDTYFIKFDPKKYPQLATSAEVICDKFFHLIGYNVPEYYLVFLKRDQLMVDPKATITEKEGKKRPMSEKDIDDLLLRVGRLKDGRIPVSASLKLSGDDIGKFKYWGTRSDDANDIFPHEDHRELRALRVFAAWLNHDDSRSINTLNVYLPEGDKGYIKHYLIDFGSTLGSSSVTIQGHRSGNEYILEKGPILRSGLTLGLWDRSWRHYKYPSFPEVGRIESAHFDPGKWRPEYPNPAFQKMQNEDAFWAIEIIMKFTDDVIRAVVGTGRIMNDAAEKYLADTLIERRNKIIQHYLALVNPVSFFEVSGDSLHFKNLGEEAGLASQTLYEYQWFRFNNGGNTSQPLQSVQKAAQPSLDIPEDSSPYLMVTIRSINPAQPQWKKKAEIYLRNGVEKKIVGIEREN